MQHGIDAVQHVVTRTEVNLESDRRQDVLFFGLSVAGIILGVLLLAWSVVRSVNRPLRALTASARDLSEHRLPALVDSLHKGADVIATQLDSLTPIEVQSEDELGELANAFNSVQQTTANVARQQVELLRKGIGDLYVSRDARNADVEHVTTSRRACAATPRTCSSCPAPTSPGNGASRSRSSMSCVPPPPRSPTSRASRFTDSTRRSP